MENNELENLPNIENNQQLINPAKPYIMEDYHKEQRKRWHKLAAVLLTVFVGVVCVGMLGSWMVSIYMSDLNQKAINREHTLETQETEFQDSFNNLVEGFRSTNEKNYDYDKVMNELFDLKRFKQEVNEADWYNVYNGTISDKKDDLTNQIDMKYKQLADMVVADYEEQIQAIEIDPSYFDSDGNPIEDKLPSSELMYNGMATLVALLPTIMTDNNNYQLYEEEEFFNILDRLSAIESNTNRLYYAASEKELTTKAKEEADKKFEENKDNIRNELEKELNEKLTEELSLKYSNEKQDALNEKDKEISTLKQDIERYKSDYESLKEQYDKLNEENKLLKEQSTESTQ